MTDLSQDSMTGEQWVFEERTADPITTEEGERWLRTDLNSGDKLATLRVDVGDSIRDVPIFSTGTAVDTVSEAMRVQVNGVTGYVPIVPVSDAAYPELRMQHNSQVHGYHDRVEPGSAIPDSVIHRWDFDDDGSTGTLTDQVGSADGTINGWVYTTNAIQGTHAGDHDGSDDYTDLPTGLFPDRTADWTYATWINLDTLGSDDRIIDFRGEFQHILNVGRSGTDTLGLFQDGSDNAIRTISTGANYWILVEHDSSVPEVRVEVNRTQELTISSTPDSPGTSTNTFFSNGPTVGNHPDGRQDETIIADSLLTSSEKDELYGRGT